MEKEQKQKGWVFGLLWLILNTLAWSLYMPLAMAFGWLVWEFYDSFMGMGPAWLLSLFGDEFTRIMIATLLLGVCLGVILGLLQNAALARGLAIRMASWIMATTVGMILFIVFSGVIPSLLSLLAMTFGFELSLVRLSIGVFAFLSIPALGLAQWFVLRRYFAEAEWWILATVCTSVAMTVLSYVLPRDDHGFILFGLVPTLQGALYGLATWMVFVLVLKRSTSASKAFDLQT